MNDTTLQTEQFVALVGNAGAVSYTHLAGVCELLHTSRLPTPPWVTHLRRCPEPVHYGWAEGLLVLCPV